MPRQYVIRLIYGIDNLPAAWQRDHSNVDTSRLLCATPYFMRIPYGFLCGIQFCHPYRQFRRPAPCLCKVRKRPSIHKQHFPKGVQNCFTNPQPMVCIGNPRLGIGKSYSMSRNDGKPSERQSPLFPTCFIFALLYDAICRDYTTFPAAPAICGRFTRC